MIENIGTPTIRDRIMEVLKARFEAIAVNVDGHILTWNTVVRRPLTDAEQQAGDAIALIDTAETKTEEVGYTRCDLTVFTEFWIKIYAGDDASQFVNAALGDVQRIMRSDLNTQEADGTCLTIDVQETRNETDIEGAADLLVGGVVQWSILYRHNVQDPRLLR